MCYYLVSSRIEQIDPAILRPGRLDIHISIPLPNPEARKQIISKTLEEMPNVLTELDIDWIVKETHEKSSSDLIDLCREAGMICIRQDRDIINVEDLITALNK